MQSEAKLNSSHLEDDMFYRSSRLNENHSTSFFIDQEWKRTISSKSRSNSESSFKSFHSSQQFNSNSADFDQENDSRKTLDDEEYLDDDETEDEEYDDDDDDGIVLDCDDDQDSSCEIDFSYPFAKHQQVYGNGKHLLNPYETLNKHEARFTNQYPVLNTHSNDLFPNNVQDLKQSLSGEAKLSTKITTAVSSLKSNSGDVPDDIKLKKIIGSSEKQQRFLRILKQSGKFKDEIYTCNECGEIIMDRDMFRLEGRYWHIKCLKCNICGTSLTTKCFFRNEKTFCKDDYDKVFATKCITCEQIIPKSSPMRELGGRCYHVDCFRCCMCKVTLGTGSKFYLMNGCNVICSKDYDQEKAKEANSDSKRPRTSISADQLETLKSAYSQSSKPARHVREQLSNKTGLDLRVVQVWFQNRRAKEKRLHKETEQQGKYGGHFRGSGVAIGSIDHELNAGIAKRSGRSGLGGNRKRTNAASGRLHHHSRLTVSLQQNGMINQSFHFANIGENCYGVPTLNGNGPMPLHLISGPSDIPSSSFTQQIHERLTHPQMTLENSSAFACRLIEQPLTLAPGLPPADPYNYTQAEQQSDIQTTIDLPQIPCSKLDTDYSPQVVESIKEPNPHSFSLPPPELIGNRFPVTCSQAKSPLSIFPDSHETTVLSEMPVARSWLNEQPSAAQQL